ncbi:unnamed protein product [Brachionus calyciflorus]|uniref:Uncharacterized protein n=1 Tax=Brachionus calyciflorus TaxID=104777 RepID=A0A814BZU7_9BILA|nr:unnamed protein product [Brachionus calyciflorus]
MKIYFILFLISLSVNLYQSVPGPSSNSSIRCVHSKKKIKCKLQNEQRVECNAISNLVGLGSTLFNVFGIGALPKEYNYSNIENVFYYLYPRSLDELVYFNHSIRLNETSVDLNLFYSVESNVNNPSYGIRVTDKLCFGNLVKILRQVDEVKTVQVKQSLIGNGQQVDLFGEVVIENNLKKRDWDDDGYGDFDFDRYKYSWNRYGYYGGWYGGYYGKK